MPYPEPFTAQTIRERNIVERARAAAAVAAIHADAHDAEGTFPVEGLACLAESGYLALAIPEDLGGEGATLTELTLGNLELAKGDASLALVIAMHGSYVGRTRDAGLWPEALFERVGREMVAARTGHGALINSLATEPEMGSPSRGGMPRTRAERTPRGWRITGRKSFSSGSTVLRWAVVSATLQDTSGPRLTNFLVPFDDPAVRVERSWDSLGMRSTESHTVVLDGVTVPADAEVARPGAPQPRALSVPHERAWGLTWAVVYLGVAEAARDAALVFAHERRPSALDGKSIATVPQVRQRAGHIDLVLYQARGQLLATTRAWDTAASSRERRAMDGALAAAKMTSTNVAVSVADEAMRLVGGSSLDRASALQRHFRDVRGGLHHPPQDDATLELLASAALD